MPYRITIWLLAFCGLALGSAAQRTLRNLRSIPFHGGTLRVEAAKTVDDPGFKLTFPVILVHGGFQDRSMWREQQDAFLNQAQPVITIDLPGHGESVSGSGRPDADAILLAVMDSLHLKQAHIVGLSFGSAIALEFASRHPERVSKLVLAAPGLAGWEEVAKMDTITIAAFANMGAALEREDTTEAARQFVQSWYVGPFRKKSDLPKDLYQYGLTTTLRNMRDHHASGWPEFNQPQSVHRLDSVRMPVLLLVGTKDMVDVGRVSTYLKKHLPHAREVRFPGAAHMLNLEQPERFNKTVLQFLTRP